MAKYDVNDKVIIVKELLPITHNSIGKVGVIKQIFDNGAYSVQLTSGLYTSFIHNEVIKIGSKNKLIRLFYS